MVDLVENWKDYSAQGKINLIKTAKLFIASANSSVIGFLDIFVGLVGVLKFIKWFWQKLLDIIVTCWEAIKTAVKCVEEKINNGAEYV